MIKPNRFYTTREASELTGICPKKVNQYVNDGTLPTIKEENFRVFYGRDLQNLIVKRNEIKRVSHNGGREVT